MHPTELQRDQQVQHLAPTEEAERAAATQDLQAETRLNKGSEADDFMI